MKEFAGLAEGVERKFPRQFEVLESALARGKFDDRRRNIALMRIVGPLLDASDTAYIERRWNELTNDELRQFIHAGIRREVILLRRSPDAQRAQEIADTFIADLPPGDAAVTRPFYKVRCCLANLTRPDS